jgi:chromosome segregation ATPase
MTPTTPTPTPAPTPRTDAQPIPDAGYTLVSRNFARTLERELAQAQAALAETTERNLELMALAERLTRQIGSIGPGDHPDEQKPRAETWLQERKNWADEVVRMRAALAAKDREIEAFKANNRYMRGHTAGYEEARSKFEPRLRTEEVLHKAARARAEKAEGKVAHLQDEMNRLNADVEALFNERDQLRAEVERLSGVKNQLERTGFTTITQLADAWLSHKNTFKSQTAYVEEVEAREAQLRARVAELEKDKLSSDRLLVAAHEELKDAFETLGNIGRFDEQVERLMKVVAAIDAARVGEGKKA